MSETLKEYDNPLLYLDKSNSAVLDVSHIISTLYLDIADNSYVVSTFDYSVARRRCHLAWYIS